MAALVLGATDSSAGLWLLVALAFGLAGDVFLLGDSDTRFRLGLAAFLVGHLAFVVSFIRLGLDPAGLGLGGLGGAGRLPARDPAGGPRDVPPRRLRRSPPRSRLYTMVIGAMVIYAFDTGDPTDRASARRCSPSATRSWPSTGSSGRSPWAPVVVMVTYHVGQALIVAGVLAAT